MANRKFIPNRSFQVVVKGKKTTLSQGKEVSLSPEQAEQVQPNWGKFVEAKTETKKAASKK